jgi:hypothetical protein
VQRLRLTDACNLALQNGINVLQAAALATQAAFQNPALQPILMGSTPWLNPIYQNIPGLVAPPGTSPAVAVAALANAQLAQVPTGGPGSQVLDGNPLAATAAAASQYGASLPGGVSGVHGRVRTSHAGQLPCGGAQLLLRA